MSRNMKCHQFLSILVILSFSNVVCGFVFCRRSIFAGNKSNEIRKHVLSLKGDDNENDAVSNKFRNPFESLSLFNGGNKENVQSLEERNKKELARQRRILVDEAEVRRQERVREDSLPYLVLFGLQFLSLANEW